MEKGWRSVNIKKKMLKTIIEELVKKRRKKIMTWMLMWLNWSVATINSILQLLEIYRCGLVNCCVTKNRVQEFQKKRFKRCFV